MLSDKYIATAKFEIHRFLAPNDKATYTTEFYIDPKDSHQNDDLDVHALMGAYDWFKFLASEITSSRSNLKPVSLELQAERNHDCSEQLFEWDYKQPLKLKEAVQFACKGDFSSKKPNVQHGTSKKSIQS